MSGAAAAFLDRDGVVNELVAEAVGGVFESPLRVADVRLIPGAAQAVRRLTAAGWLVIGVSNQPAAAKGLISLEQLMAVQARVLELVTAQGARFDGFRICLHHPRGIVPELSGGCECRKPAPGLLLDAAAELGIDLSRSWMIGDTGADVLAARWAGCRTILVENPLSAHKRPADLQPDATARSLAEAAERLAREPVD